MVRSANQRWSAERTTTIADSSFCAGPYYYRSPTEYQTFARYMRDTLPRAFLREDLWPKSSRQVQVGLSLYPSYYFGASYCAEDRPATMRAKTTSPDDYFLVNDDHVQVLIASPKEPEKLIYRFMLNSLNLSNDAFVRENPDPKTRSRDPLIVDVKGYNPDWHHAVHILADAWTAEFRIPWKSLTIAAPPRPGTSLRLNLGRFRSQGLNWERTYWSPVLEMKGDTFERLDPDLFGTVRLK